MVAFAAYCQPYARWKEAWEHITSVSSTFETDKVGLRVLGITAGMRVLMFADFYFWISNYWQIVGIRLLYS